MEYKVNILKKWTLYYINFDERNQMSLQYCIHVIISLNKKVILTKFELEDGSKFETKTFGFSFFLSYICDLLSTYTKKKILNHLFMECKTFFCEINFTLHKEIFKLLFSVQVWTTNKINYKFTKEKKEIPGKEERASQTLYNLLIQILLKLFVNSMKLLLSKYNIEMMFDFFRYNYL